MRPWFQPWRMEGRRGSLMSMDPRGVETVADWNDRPIRMDRSPGGVLLFCDVDDALIHTDEASWPPPQVVMKLGAAQHGAKLPASVRDKLGHYSALQSVNSEDAITWNFFGALINRPAIGAEFLNWLSAQLELPWGENKTATTDVWRRVPHPDKPIAPGPELDAVLVAERLVVMAEAKWGSAEGTGQGVARDKGQIQLRRDFLTTYGRRLWGDAGFSFSASPSTARSLCPPVRTSTVWLSARSRGPVSPSGPDIRVVTSSPDTCSGRRLTGRRDRAIARLPPSPRTGDLRDGTNGHAVELETYLDPLAGVRRVLAGADEILLGVAFVSAGHQPSRAAAEKRRDGPARNNDGLRVHDQARTRCGPGGWARRPRN